MKEICFGMPTLAETCSLEENAELCRRLGLRFVELNRNLPEYQTLNDANRFLRIAEEYGIFFTIHLEESLDPACFSPLVRSAWTETALLAIDAAKTLGAPVVNMHMNPGVRVTLPDRKLDLYERDYDLYLQAMTEFRDRCEERTDGKVRVSVENTGGWKEWEKQAVDRLLESPAFGLTWDIGHSRAAEEVDAPFLLERSARLGHFHIHDCREKSNHLALGDGEINLDARLTLAAELGARCVLETKTSAALEKSVRWLRERGWMM